MSGNVRVTPTSKSHGPSRGVRESRKPHEIRLSLNDRGQFMVPGEDIVRYLGSLKPTSAIPSSNDLRKLMDVTTAKKNRFKKSEFTVREAKWTMQDISAMLTTYDPKNYDLLEEVHDVLADKEGNLSLEDMKKLLALVGLDEKKEPINMEVLAEIIDSDGDGDISVNDIRTMFEMPYRQPGFARFRRSSSVAVKRRGAVQLDFRLVDQLE
mmetsp:Transcript_7883/g.8558  ORF Transcript_7883/g.8558 Transcript_7883/m.8558 type:complete len:210 (-) Transcript_7883:334-963(-)